MRMVALILLTVLGGCGAPATRVYTAAGPLERAAVSERIALVIPQRLQGPVNAESAGPVDSAEVGSSLEGGIVVAWTYEDRRRINVSRLLDNHFDPPVSVSVSEISGYSWFDFHSHTRCLVWHRGTWYLLLPGNEKLRILRVTAEKAEVVSKPFKGGDFIWAFSRGDYLDVFWTDSYLPRFAWPGNGLDMHRLRFRTGKVEGDWGPPKTVREYRGKDKYEPWHEYEVVRVGRSRYDLFFESKIEPFKDLFPTPLFHERNLLTWIRRRTCIGEVFWGSRCILVGPNEKMVVLWLEGYEHTAAPGPEPTRLVMAEHDETKRWSDPSIIAQGRGWRPGSLAAARTDNGITYAIWQDEKDCLGYAARSAEGVWGNAAHTSLPIGRRNWLVPVQEDLLLVTLYNENLYWCRLGTHGSRQ